MLSRVEGLVLGPARAHAAVGQRWFAWLSAEDPLHAIRIAAVTPRTA
jgi:hypothetical protein